MKILIACERSGRVRDAFLSAGHDAWSCDVVPSLSAGPHLLGDVRDYLGNGWDLMIAHPPCQYLSYAANNCWNAPGRESKRLAAMRFFMELYFADIPRVCVENPVGWPSTVFRKPDQIVHPYYFGDSARKRTCFWLRGLPPLDYTPLGELFPHTACEQPPPVYFREGKSIHFTEAHSGGSFARSLTFPGIASAMAAQWGSLASPQRVAGVG
jgi:hypothetical protein